MHSKIKSCNTCGNTDEIKNTNKVPLSKLKRVVAVIFSALALACFFMGGYFTCYLNIPPAVRTLQWVKEMVQKYYYEEISDEQFLNASLSTVFGNGKDSLLDAYSTYYTPENYQVQANTMSGNRTGSGLTYWLVGQGDEQETLIYRVYGNSAAENAGLRVGMYLRGYGTDVDHITYGGYSAEYTTFMSTREDGQSYVLLASTSAGAEAEIAVYELCNKPYKQNYVFYYDNEKGYHFTGEQALIPTEFDSNYSFLPNECAVIRLESFAGNAAKQMEQALKIFKERGKKRLLLDVRNNGGGDMSVLTEIAQYFSKKAPMSEFYVAKSVYRGGRTQAFTAAKNCFYDYFSDDIKIIVLANRNSASATEALLGAMLDYGTISASDVYLADFDGEAKTYGKGIMQTSFVNPFTHEAIKLTTATLHWPVSDKCIHDVGFLPADGAISVTCDAVVEYVDNMVRKIVCG